MRLTKIAITRGDFVTVEQERKNGAKPGCRFIFWCLCFAVSVHGELEAATIELNLPFSTTHALRRPSFSPRDDVQSNPFFSRGSLAIEFLNLLSLAHLNDVMVTLGGDHRPGVG